ncbi:hypothetical protein [Streptomyces sp. NPDC048269]|uniref:hypothetical protein n=1 Tax=Streptomyces sp. NPDC048269 TaxID=3155753 RepID=UPI0034163CA0
MSRSSRTLRLALLTASTSLAAGGVLLPTGAFAATPATTPHAITLPADRGGNDHEERQGGDWEKSGDWNKNRGGSHGKDTDESQGEDQDRSEPTDPGSGVVPEDYCNDPKGLPGLCVDGKPLPKGDGTVMVPQGTVVESGTGSSTVELAV